MANLAFNRNGMLSKPKPMQPGTSPPIMGPAMTPPAPTMGPLGGSANDIAPGGVMSRPPVMTDRIPGKPTLGTMGGRPPEDFGGMASTLLPTDPNAPPTGGQRMQQLQGLFGGGMPSGGPQFSGFGGMPGGGGMSAPAPQMGGGMTATRPGFGYGRRFDPGLR